VVFCRQAVPIFFAGEFIAGSGFIRPPRRWPDRPNSSAGVPKKAQSRPESAVAASPFQGHASVPREPLQKQMREYPAIIDVNENN